MSEGQYSRMRIGGGKAHVLDRLSGKVLCGTPFAGLRTNLTKSQYDAQTMLERHSGIAERRGGINAHKWCCLKCLKSLEELARK